MFRRLGQFARKIKRELCFYRNIAGHPRTPIISKWCIGAAVGYALLPFDLIPDFIPVIGQLDDVIVIPTLIIFGMWLVPADVKAECRSATKAATIPAPSASSTSKLKTDRVASQRGY